MNSRDLWENLGVENADEVVCVEAADRIHIGYEARYDSKFSAPCQ